MEVLTTETQKLGLVPAITKSIAIGPHTSIFIPINEGDTGGDIRKKITSAYRQAEELLQKSMDSDEVESYLKPAKKILDSYRSMPGIRGIAIFRSNEAFYHTSLQEAPPELVVVASSFHIKPIIHCISSRADCFALMITARYLKVFKLEGDELNLVKSYPNEFDEPSLKKEGGFIGQRKRGKEITERFIQDVTKSLAKDFRINRSEVAVLGPRSLRQRIIAELSSKVKTEVFYESTIFPSFSEMARALKDALKFMKKEASQKYIERVINTNNESMVTNSLSDIATAAVSGRIERLMIDPSIQVWGLFDRSSGLIRTHTRQISDEDDCVVDDITEEVIKKGGEVIFFDSTRLENVAPYMATLRW